MRPQIRSIALATVDARVDSRSISTSFRTNTNRLGLSKRHCSPAAMVSDAGVLRKLSIALSLDYSTQVKTSPR